ncbi:MAG: toprim domain-containing protein [Halobacteria archaeon]
MRWGNPRERYENLEAVLEQLRKEAGGDTVVLVEGRRDEKALTELGVSSDVVRLSGNGLSLAENAVEVSRSYQTAILLTDWDSEGEQLMLKVKDLLESYGVTPNTLHRHRLRNLTSKDIYDVESLAVYRENLKREI